MHVVGARFANLESASAALDEIRASLSIPLADAAVRPLGSTHYEESASGFLLAGRFQGVDVDRVLGIVELHGGTLVSRRIEQPYPGLAGSRLQGRALERHGSQASRSGAVPAPLRGAHQRLRRPAALERVRAARGRGFSV